MLVMRRDNRHIILLLLLICAFIMTACDTGGDDDAPPTRTEVVISQRLATLGPTPTPDPNQPVILPTATPTITPIPSPTNYVGVFLGELPAESDLLANDPPEQGNIQVIPEVVNPLICPAQLDPIFGTTWQSESRAVNGLRCPIQVAFGFQARVQFFENGVMYHNPETDEVWAIAPGGLVGTGAGWFVTQLPQVILTGISPPSGLFIPTGIIGTVWGGTTDIRETLGFATTLEQETPLNIQRFDGGTLILDVDVGQVFVILVDGTAFGPF